MTLLFFALVFCCACSAGGVFFLTARQRAARREIRLIRARCAMLDALEKLDERIWKGNFPADSLTIAFQEFAWQAKDRSAIFTVKNFLPIFFGGMEQFAYALDLRRRISVEMSQVPRLNHAQELFLKGYYEFMRCRHPVFVFLLGVKNHWMLRRYQQLSRQCRENLVAAREQRLAERNSSGTTPPNFRSACWRDLLPVMQAA